MLLGWGGWIRTNEMADPKSAALPLGYTPMKVVERTGFEPVKAVPADLQSAPFGQLGYPSTTDKSYYIILQTDRQDF